MGAGSSTGWASRGDPIPAPTRAQPSMPNRLAVSLAHSARSTSTGVHVDGPFGSCSPSIGWPSLDSSLALIVSTPNRRRYSACVYFSLLGSDPSNAASASSDMNAASAVRHDRMADAVAGPTPNSGSDKASTASAANSASCVLPGSLPVALSKAAFNASAMAVSPLLLTLARSPGRNVPLCCGSGRQLHTLHRLATSGRR
ncbi:hypothetical protein BC831DRAFT_58455 [Entophlyctis helioformis]|nr:hypothetical protein BC831DRAFT_58455 [Entophlyctis helioformis]